MKRLLVTTLLVAALGTAQAQNKIRFGLQAGMLRNDQRYQTSQVDRPLVPRTYPASQSTDDRQPALGYLIGATAAYCLTNHLALGLNLSWYRSASTNHHQYSQLDGNRAEYTDVERYRFQYVQIPVWIQYTLTQVKLAPYLRTGPTYTYLLHPSLSTTTSYSDPTQTPSSGSDQYSRTLPYKGGYGGSFPHPDWQVMTEVGLSISKHLKLGIRYDLLAPQRTIIEIGAADGAIYHSFRNRNLIVLTEISF